MHFKSFIQQYCKYMPLSTEIGLCVGRGQGQLKGQLKAANVGGAGDLSWAQPGEEARIEGRVGW